MPKPKSEFIPGDSLETSELATPMTMEEAKKMISALQTAVAAAEGMKGQPVITPALMQEIDQIGAECAKLGVRLGKLRAALNKIAGGTVKKPVFVYRYVDGEGKEGFVPDDGTPEAEGKARLLDADKRIEYGYAYADEKNPGKFVGFHATETIDGTAPGRY